MSRSLAALMLLAVLGAPCVWAQSTATFTAAGNMTTARSGHIATVLRDGTVLIVGGSRDRPASAEIYDPAAPTPGTFTATGDMTTARSGATATLLGDGTVLIVGGDRFTGSAPLKSSAERYDPSTGTFTPTGDMVTVQIGGTATLLNNGKVLIAGGTTSLCCDADPVSAANPELYDPSTGTFTLTGTFANAGAGPYVTGGPDVSAATLLPDGRVLIAGTPASELYDPVTGTFSLTGAMTTPCVIGGRPTYIGGRTATLLTNGKVLVAGGTHEDCGRFANAELYDPATGTFTATGTMTRARNNHTATLLPDGTVLIAGGESQNCVARACTFSGTDASAEFYDPSTGTFAAVGNMTARRAGHTATGLKTGTVLIAGGYFYAGIGGGSCCFASAELYPAAGLAAPAPVFPVDGIVTENLRPRLQVHNVKMTGAVGTLTYRFEWSDRSDFQPGGHTTFKDHVLEGGGGDTAHEITEDLAPNTLHYWHARATRTQVVGKTDFTLTSEYSQVRSFRTPNVGVISETRCLYWSPRLAPRLRATSCPAPGRLTPGWPPGLQASSQLPAGAASC